MKIRQTFHTVSLKVEEILNTIYCKISTICIQSTTNQQTIRIRPLILFQRVNHKLVKSSSKFLSIDSHNIAMHKQVIILILRNPINFIFQMAELAMKVSKHHILKKLKKNKIWRVKLIKETPNTNLLIEKWKLKILAQLCSK